MQGAERTDRNRTALPGRLDDLPGTRPEVQGNRCRVDWHYVNWVDRYNTLGLGANVSVVLGTCSDSLQIFKPDTKAVVHHTRALSDGASTRAISTGASMIRKQAGKGGGCGLPRKHASSGMWKAAKVRRLKWFTSSFGLIRWPGEASPQWPRIVSCLEVCGYVHMHKVGGWHKRCSRFG